MQHREMGDISQSGNERSGEIDWDATDARIVAGHAPAGKALVAAMEIAEATTPCSQRGVIIR